MSIFSSGATIIFALIHSFRKAAPLGVAILACVMLSLQAVLAQVIPDGRTQTTVTGAGAVSNVHTGTISQGHGINSFSNFNVNSGQTVNIHIPGGAVGTVNVVNGPQATIHGMVQSMQGGQVGGDMYIASPQGFVVGPQGVVRGGSVHLSTPSQSAVNGMFLPGGGLSGSHVTNIINGTAPYGPGGIDVQGRIHGVDATSLRSGGRIRISGEVTGGRVDVYSGRNVEVTGGGQVRSTRGGRVNIRSGGNIQIRRGARVLSQSEGARDAGTIHGFAEDADLLEVGAVVSAAALGSGEGGFIEFSGRNIVQAFGELEVFSRTGQAGTIFIDPDIAEIKSRDTDGGNLIVAAREKIVLIEDSIINTLSSAGAGG